MSELDQKASFPSTLGEVHREIERLKQISDELYKRYSDLQEILVSILRPSEEANFATPNDDLSDSPGLVPLATDIYTVNSSLSELSRRLNVLMDRISL